MNEQYARLIQLVLAGRPERVTEAMLATMSEAERRAYVEAESILAAYASGLASPVIPSAGLRDRVLASFQAKLAAPKRTALLVLDMIRDHLSEDAVLEVPRAREIVPAVRQRIVESRSLGIPVVYLVDEHAHNDPDLESWGAHAVEGSGGNDIWPDLAPGPNDRVVKKSTYSAFANSELQQVLDTLGCDSLVLTGCLTEIGIMATATDALQRGYAVEVPTNAQAGLSEFTENVTLSTLRVMPPYGAARAELLSRLSSAA